MSRRRFLSTAGRFAGGLLAAPLVPFPGLARPGASPSRVALARLDTYDRPLVRAALEAQFTALGGLSTLIRPGDTVGIKINLTGGSAWADTFRQSSGLSASETFWTHPEVLRATLELLRDAGAGRLVVLEALYDVRSFLSFGYGEAAAFVGAEYIDLNAPAPYAGFDIRPVGDRALLHESFVQHGILSELDVLVSLAKAKEHVSAGVTHGMKNLIGSLPLLPQYTAGTGHRAAVHSLPGADDDPDNNLCRTILDLNLASPLHLVVNDAVRTVAGGEGPWLDLTPIAPGALIVSADPVAADAVATQVLGFDPAAPDRTGPFAGCLNYLALASEIGMGVHDPDQIEVIETTATASSHPKPAAPSETLQAFPNPFDRRLVLLTTLPHDTPARLSIHDPAGRTVSILHDGMLARGWHRFEWQRRSATGSSAASGVYTIVLQTETGRVSAGAVALPVSR